MTSLQRHIGLAILAALGLLVFFFGGLYIFGWQYDNRVLPGITVGRVPVGKMKKPAVKNFLELMTDKLISEGLQLKYQTAGGEKTMVVYPVIVVDGNPIELVHLDSEMAANALVNLGKTDFRVLNGWLALRSMFFSQEATLAGVSVNTTLLSALLVENLASYETPPVDASIQINGSDLSDYKITPARVGFVYNLSNLIKQIGDSWSKLKSAQMVVSLQEIKPAVNELDVEKITPRLSKQLVAPISLIYEDPQILDNRVWYLGEEKIKKWLNAQRTPDGVVVSGLSEEKVKNYLNDVIAPLVDVEPINAKLKMEGEKVVEFQGSQFGAELSLDDAYKAISEIMRGRTLYDDGVPKEVFLTTAKTEPEIKTADLNNFGIKEVLGVGVSDYSNSPANRIKNIANAVKKLNGLLIKPGEEFSTLKYTAPFTLDGGYLPELVIKGDEIKPEIGGGLCQIATTLFRMAMNSAMKITSRRNHALVVNHYNDPINGNPGTDATVYDPAPDFKFLNDTNNYILIQTQMDKKRQELIFTVWGTPDGRSGSYTHPTVSKWYPYGETKIVETDTLEPGKEKCQNPFRGADASFVYTRIMPDGKEEKTVYDSHYRPLPKICLKGKQPNATASSTPAVDGLSLTSEPVVVE